MRLQEVVRGCLEIPERYSGIEVTGVTSDSREVRPGYLFVAVLGEKTDGHHFLREAAESGAVVVLGEKSHQKSVSRLRDPGLSPGVPYLRVPDTRAILGSLARNLYSRSLDQLLIAGVTGTKGKTTTTWILDAILRGAGKTTALFGTVHNRVAQKIYSSENTTPGCIQLHRHLRELADAGGTHAVLEVSSHGILQRRTAGINFRCGVFTNVASEHLDYHKTFESYVETKVSFFTDLDRSAFAVLPREEATSLRIVARVKAQVLWYGTDAQDGVERLRMTPEGLAFNWKGFKVRSQLWGYHNLLNILGAMTAAESLGIGREEIAHGVASAAAPPGRLEQVAPGLPFNVFVDYAHTDGSLETVLKALRASTPPPGRLITIFGCGGDRDRSKRPRMGSVAEEWSDHVVITSDNPRSEDPQAILEEIQRGLKRPEDVVLEVDRREAIALGIRMARAGDTVLIAGKGHESYQECQGNKQHFDDREVAREFLSELHTF